MDLKIIAIAGDPQALDAHGGRVRSIAIEEKNLIVFTAAVEPGDPVGFDLPVFDFFLAGGDEVKPFSLNRETQCFR